MYNTSYVNRDMCVHTVAFQFDSVCKTYIWKEWFGA